MLIARNKCLLKPFSSLFLLDNTDNYWYTFLQEVRTLVERFDGYKGEFNLENHRANREVTLEMPPTVRPYKLEGHLDTLFRGVFDKRYPLEKKQALRVFFPNGEEGTIASSWGKQFNRNQWYPRFHLLVERVSITKQTESYILKLQFSVHVDRSKHELDLRSKAKDQAEIWADALLRQLR
jgi:hypothetical protein